MDHLRSKDKIQAFISNYGVDSSEFLDPVDSFSSFNEFFYRRLKPEARPIDPDGDSVVFPADGRHLMFTDLSRVQQVYAKGQSFDLATLFGSVDLAGEFKNGMLVISRLCPVDYHRFHFPISGETSSPRLINGDLFSVSPIALRKRLSILWQNKRYLSLMENNRIGRVAQFLVGATCVGSVHFSNAKSKVCKGEELGYFSFGGSCVMSFFPANSIEFVPALTNWSAKGIEIYAKMGERMGRLNGA